MIDWPLARRVARLAAGSADVPELVADLPALTEDAERRVVAYTGLVPSSRLPAPEAVDRQAWADINLRGLRGVLDPVAEKLRPRDGLLAGPMQSAAGGLIAVEVGGLTGLMAQRVLGQFELVLLDPDSATRLLFLAPNLVDAARKLDVDLDQLVAWVAFHEVTHAVQFTSVPWLRDHLAGLLRELLDGIDLEIDMRSALRLPTREDVERVVAAFREGGLVTLVAGTERMALLERVQAVMAVIEGHAEHVMDEVGRDALPDLDGLRRALNRRRADRTGPWRLLERLLGLEMKMRQYEVGKRFCDEVAQREGVVGLHRVFAGPEALPTWDELQAPEAWFARMRTAA